MNRVVNIEREIEREIFIAASPETVFRFFVEPALMARWFGEQHTLDPRPGGIFASTSAPGTLRMVLIQKSYRLAASRSLGDGRAGPICRPAIPWSKSNSCLKTAAPCSGFDIAVFRKRRRRHSRQRTTRSDGRTTSCGSNSNAQF